MPLNDTQTPNSSSDVVGVFDSDFNQLFPLSRPIKCTVKEMARNMEHPVETGVTITDHRIILPTEIELSMILPPDDYRSVYQQIKQIWINAPILSVQTRTDTYDQMMIETMPHEENAEMFNAIPLALKLKRVLFVAPDSQTLPASSVADPVDQSTVQRGQQQPGATEIMPPPVQGGSGSALPQVPTPPRGGDLRAPNPPPPGMNSDQYKQVYGAVNFNGNGAGDALPP